MLYNTAQHNFVQLGTSFFSCALILSVFNNTVTYTFSGVCVNDSLIWLYMLSSATLTIPLLGAVIYYTYMRVYMSYTMSIYIFSSLILFYFVIPSFKSGFVTQLLHSEPLNTALQNGFLNIHPPIIYIMYSYATVTLISAYHIRLTTKLFYTTTYKLHTWLIVGMYGIILGAWWAAQELNWGGFWSWDPVEIVSIAVFVYLCYTLHTPKTLFSNGPTFWDFILITLLVYGIIRLGLVATIHSFVSNNNKGFLVILVISLLVAHGCGTFFLNKIPTISFYLYNSCYCKLRQVVLLKQALYLNLLFLNCTLIYLLLKDQLKSFLLIFPDLKTGIHVIIVYLSLVYLYNLYLCKHDVRGYLVVVCVIMLLTSSIMLTTLSIILLNLVGIRSKRTLHTWLLISYIFFYLCFLNYIPYTPKHLETKWCINSAVGVFNYTWDLFCEKAFFMRKVLYLYKYKALWVHTNGFEGFSNGFITNFLFAKSLNVRALYIEESIGLYFYIVHIIVIFYYNACRPRISL